MATYQLGINTCFAVKRWPQPERWARLISEDLGLQLVQHSLDLVDVGADEGILEMEANAVRAACSKHGLTLDSTFTGLAAYSSNMLLDPRVEVREYWEEWFVRAIRFSALAGAPVIGGHVGAFTVDDWRDSDRREARWRDLKIALGRLTAEARRQGLVGIYIENLAAAREPSTMGQIDDLLTTGDAYHVPVLLCLDVGHQCVPGTTGRDRDPYAWLESYAMRLGAVQLQQTDAENDHHWSFTAGHNAAGRIEAGRVLTALAAGGGNHTRLLFEVIPPFEQDDDAVLAELVESVRYWQEALSHHEGAQTSGSQS